MDGESLTEEERSTLRELKEHLIKEAKGKGSKQGALKTLQEYRRFVSFGCYRIRIIHIMLQSWRVLGTRIEFSNPVNFEIAFLRKKKLWKIWLNVKFVAATDAYEFRDFSTQNKLGFTLQQVIKRVPSVFFPIFREACEPTNTEFKYGSTSNVKLQQDHKTYSLSDLPRWRHSQRNWT